MLIIGALILPFQVYLISALHGNIEAMVGKYPKIDLHELVATDGVDLDAALDDLKALYRDIDARNEKNTKGLDLPCQQGCSDCCKESVFLTPLEFFAIWDYIQSHVTESERVEIIERGLDLYNQNRDRIEAFFKPPPDGEKDHFSIARDLQFTCPYLDQEGGCKVYPVRELFARIFGCSFNDEGGVYGCHLVGAHLGGQTVTLLRSRSTAKRLDALPLTQMRQVHPWYLYWLYQERESPPPVLAG